MTTGLGDKGTRGQGEEKQGSSCLPVQRRRRRTLFVVAVLLLAGGVAAAWWWRHRPVPVVVPGVPSYVTDPEVVQAVQRARQKVADKPDDARAWGNLGMVFMAHDTRLEADACFAEATRLDPRSPRWPYGRGLLEMDRDRLPFLRQAAALADTWADYRAPVYLRLAEALLEQHQLDEAEQLFQEAFHRGQNNGGELHSEDVYLRATLGLGLIAAARNHETEAADFLTVVRTSHSPFAYKKATAQLALLARARGADQTATEYDKEVAALPEDEAWRDPFLDEVFALQVGRHVRRRQTQDLENRGDFAAAAKLNLKDIEEDPSALAYTNAGLNLVRLGRHEQALLYLREGVSRYPNAPSLHYTLAWVLIVRAKAEWQKSPGSPQAQKEFREAIAEARQTTELRPMYSWAYLIWGESLTYLGEPAAAVAPLRQGVECGPEKFDLHLALGEALLQSGQYAEAETELKDAQKLNPQDARPDQALKLLRAGWWQRQFQQVR